MVAVLDSALVDSQALSYPLIHVIDIGANVDQYLVDGRIRVLALFE